MRLKTLFLDDYIFKGEHEVKSRTLTSLIDKESGTKVFNSAVELFITSAIVGCYYNKKSKPQKGDKTFKIMSSQFQNHYDVLLFIYKLTMLIGDEDNIGDIDRINRAFRYTDNQDNLSLFEEYMLGGLDEIYDRFMVSTNKRYDDYLISLRSFLDSIMKNNNNNNFDDDEDIFSGDVF